MRRNHRRESEFERVRTAGVRERWEVRPSRSLGPMALKPPPKRSASAAPDGPAAGANRTAKPSDIPETPIESCAHKATSREGEAGAILLHERQPSPRATPSILTGGASPPPGVAA